MNDLKRYNLLHLVAHLFETLRYKPEGRSFDFGVVIGFFVEIILPAVIWSWSLLSL
jgi:hypothetical protein